MTLPSPFGNAVAISYLDELAAGVPTAELEAVLEVDATSDLELAQEQFALAAVIAEMDDPREASPAVAALATALKAQEGADALPAAAHACVSRLLDNPWAALWRTQRDGGLAVRRRARVLRARLHRACQG